METSSWRSLPAPVESMVPSVPGERFVFQLGDLVAEEVRLGVGLLLENREVAIQFLRHGVEQDRRLGGGQ